MYRRLKNILGVSLMILAVLIAQIPMPEARAVETNTITFSMNGGTFSGTYNGYNFKNRTPVLILDDNKKITAYPDDQYASYSGYKTEKGKWYTDKECIEEFNKESKVTESLTLYKKWYAEENGFCLNPDKTVLYQYDGGEKLVRIPDTVTAIAANAFANLGNARGIVLPKNIETVYDNAFSGADLENSVIYIYDNDSAQSEKMAQLLEDRYEQFVYSSYLDVHEVEEIAGIDYEAAADETDNKAEEAAEGSETPDSKADGEAGAATDEAGRTEETAQEKTEPESEPASEMPREYKVIFDTGVPGIAGETRTITAHGRVSELVSVAGKEAKILIKGTFSLTMDDGKKETVYLFEGWYKDAECKTAWDFANDTVEGDTTIYAKWDKKTQNYYYVTFDMNGGKYSGTYEGEMYEKVTRVRTKAVSGAGIQEAGYPEYNAGSSFQYAGYSTDKNWYTDQNCLSKYNKTDSNGNPSAVRKNMTLYKKWYATESGFTMNAKKTVLYKYNGGSGDIKIPSTVTTIGNDAFSNVSSVTSIALPDSLSDVAEDAFSGFSAVSKEVAVTAKSERAIEIARELAAKYKYLVYEGDKADAKKDDTEIAKKSDTVSVLAPNESGSIKIGARIAGHEEIGSLAADSNARTGENATSSTGIALGTSIGTTAVSTSISTAPTAAPATAPATAGEIGENSVSAGGTPAAVPAAVVPAASDAIAASGTPDAPKTISSGSSSAPAARSRTTTVSNAAAASAPAGAQHIKDTTPKTGDPVQYRMLFVCILFSAGALLVLTGNGKRKKVSPS